MADEKTPEQIEQERLAAEQAAADKKAAADAKALEAQQKRDAKAAQKKADQEKKAQDRADAKKAKEAEALAKKAQREASKLEKNGISRPLTGATKQIWDIADAISTATKEPAPRAAVMEQGKAAGLQEGTINTQYGRWRKYHGLSTVREVKPKTTAAPEAPANTGEGEGEGAAE